MQPIQPTSQTPSQATVPMQQAQQEQQPQYQAPYQNQPQTQYQDPMQGRIERHEHQRIAGVPFWGVLLILIGAIALFDNLGVGLGWVFGLAIGAWFVYLGVRHVQEGAKVNWWLVGIGLLIGLGSISTGFVDKLVFPIVLIVVGLGILAEFSWNRQNQSQ